MGEVVPRDISCGATQLDLSDRGRPQTTRHRIYCRNNPINSILRISTLRIRNGTETRAAVKGFLQINTQFLSMGHKKVINFNHRRVNLKPRPFKKAINIFHGCQLSSWFRLFISVTFRSLIRASVEFGRIQFDSSC